MKKYSMVILLGLLLIYSCSTKYVVATETPKGTISVKDSVYYVGFLEKLKSYQDSLKGASKSWTYKGKFISKEGVEIDPRTLPDFVPVEKQPEPIQSPRAAYPIQAVNEKIEGTVWVKMWVDEQGIPRLATVLESSNKIFNQPALIAGMNWIFRPAQMEGKPVAVYVSIPFKFRL